MSVETISVDIEQFQDQIDELFSNYHLSFMTRSNFDGFKHSLLDIFRYHNLTDIQLKVEMNENNQSIKIYGVRLIDQLALNSLLTEKSIH